MQGLSSAPPGPGLNYREYKGTPTDSGAVSRVLSVQVKGDNAYLELKNGPGKLTPTGAVTPAGKASVEVNVGFKLYEARRMSAAVLAYLRAWEVMQMLEYRDDIGQPPPYPVVPATSEGSENGHGASDTAPQPGSTPLVKTLPAESHGDGRPNGQVQPLEKTAAVTRARQTAEELFGPVNGQPPQPAPALRYRDGSPVDEDNSAEVQTFRRYVDEKQATPASRAVLQDYYRERAAVH